MAQLFEVFHLRKILPKHDIWLKTVMMIVHGTSKLQKAVQHKAANCELSRRHRFEDFNPSANCFSSCNFFLPWPVLVCEGKTLS